MCRKAKWNRRKGDRDQIRQTGVKVLYSDLSLWTAVAGYHFWYRTRKPMYGKLMVCKLRRDAAGCTKTYRRADIAVIRTEYRVCGTLLGTLPHLSQQNVFLGVPLVLQPEEAVLLVDKGRDSLPVFGVRRSHEVD
jgi:hypothetical protein